MKLKEVIDLLKKICDDCPGLDGNDFLVAPSKLQHSNVEGYQIHITGKFDDVMLRCLHSIALKNRLSITMEPSSVMIYQKKLTQ